MRLGTLRRRRLAAVTAVCSLALTGFIQPAHANPDDTPPNIPGLAAVTALPPSNISFPGNDGQPHKVGYDKHSFTIDGERLNIWSGEIHYWRAPDVNSWRDLFQKMRAMGYNAVSLYFFWGLHQSEEGGAFDFTPGTIKDIDLLLTLAKQEGLYVIARPGPYVNAEISMGGLPACLHDKLLGRPAQHRPEGFEGLHRLAGSFQRDRQEASHHRWWRLGHPLPGGKRAHRRRRQ